MVKKIITPDDIHKEHGISRSSHWPHFRDTIISSRGHKCELSGVQTELEAHHIIPFHFGYLLNRGYIELDPRNIIVLSRGPINYHLLLGHLDNFASFNLEIKNAIKWAKMKEKQIMEDDGWSYARLHRPKVWKDMDNKDKLSLTKLIDKLYPIH